MKKITGLYFNGAKFKATMTDEQAEAFLLTDGTTCICDGSTLDMSTVESADYDDFDYPSVKKAALREALYESEFVNDSTNDLRTVEAAINAANGVVKIWWQDMQYITLTNPKTLMIKTALGWSDSKVKVIFKRAYEIQEDNI